MTQKEERMFAELNDLQIRMERIHSISNALLSMLEDDPNTRRDYLTLTAIIKNESKDQN